MLYILYPYQNKIDDFAIPLILVYRKILVYWIFRYIGIAEKVIPIYRYWIQYRYFRTSVTLSVYRRAP